MHKILNRKISIGIGIIILLMIGAGIYLKKGGDKKSNVTNIIGKDYDQINSIIEPSDAILIFKGGPSEINLATKKIIPRDDLKIDLNQYYNLPDQGSTITHLEINNLELRSEDGSKLIVVSRILNKDKETGSAKEFICDTLKKECSPTDILASAYKAAGLKGKWYDYLKDLYYISDEERIFWTRWDSQKNILYGYSGVGDFHNYPVFIYYANNGIINKTVGYKKPVKYMPIPNDNFSPSLEKFVIASVSGKQLNLLLFGAKDLLKPVKTFDISSIYKSNDRYSQFYPISSVAWSEDENIIILETEKQIFTLNLNTGQLQLIYTSNGDNFGSFLDTNKIQLSSSKKFIVFIDYEKGHSSNESSSRDSVLKAININDDRQMIELLRSKNNLSLY